MQKGRGDDMEWVFHYPYERWHLRMFLLNQQVEELSRWCAPVWINSRGRTKRSQRIIMARDMAAARHGITAQRYTDALEEGLLDS